ncbi:MAG: hypothetical protein ABIH37_05795 [archaeon]
MENTPYFKFKPDVLKENYLEFERLCKRYLDDFVIAYSVKTNGFDEVLEVLSKLGSNFEVASLNEIEKALDFSKKAFIFNGACKNEKELRLAIESKFLINIDSKSEIDKIAEILNGRGFNIGLRVSLNKSKFGFDEDKLYEIISYCKIKSLNVISLHFHAGTQKNLKEYEESLRKIKEIVRKVSDSVDLKYLDLGGGFPDKYQLKNLSISLEDYFKLIEKYTREFDSTIIIEPGRNLVADAFDLITKVCVLKEKSGQNFAILDVGINVLSKITLANYKFSKIDISNLDYDKDSGAGKLEGNSSSLSLLNTKKERKEYILVGPLLFNNDVLGKYSESLKEGDLIKIENVGAYCYNLAWTISYDKPRVVVE